MQPAAAIVTGVHNQGLTVAVFAEGILVNLTEAWRIHSLYMDIAHAASGKTLHNLLVAAYPSGVICVAVIASGHETELDFIVKIESIAHALGKFAVFCYLDAQGQHLACLTVENLIPQGIAAYLFSIDSGNDIAFLQLRIDNLQTASRKHFGNLQTFACPVFVKQNTEVSDIP